LKPRYVIMTPTHYQTGHSIWSINLPWNETASLIKKLVNNLINIIKDIKILNLTINNQNSPIIKLVATSDPIIHPKTKNLHIKYP
jgi:hypothetical protein